MPQTFSKMMSMNSNKRKGRMNPNSKLGRSKFYSEKNMSCDGIYGNSKVMYAGASLVGCVVQVQVQNGAIYEGVLRTFSHQLDIVLEMAHKINSKCPPARGVSPTVGNLIASFPFEGGLHDKIVFRLNDVVTMQAAAVDTDYALKDSFTDAGISKFNGQVRERELEPWEGPDTETPLALTMDDDDGTNGWDANDMFRTNAEKYGVKSSYDNSLQEYTVPLTKKDTAEYKLQEARASRIAQEIETTSAHQQRALLENGDEEDRFSAVVRTQDDSKYVLPQKRRTIPGPKRQANTTSPVHPQGSTKTVQHTSSSIPGQAKQHLVVEPAEEPAVPELSKAESPSIEVAPKVVQVLCAPPPQQQALPPRIERRRDNDKKFSKQKGRMDEIEDFKKFSKNFNVLPEEKEPEEVPEAASSLAVQLERVKVDKEDDKSANVVKFSTLNPNAKEFVFNPNAKSFTPRAAPAPAPPRPQEQGGSMLALPPSQMLPQPLFTAMAPQYVSMAFPGSVPNTTRFRKAAGQPLPSQLTVQYAPPLHTSAPPQQTVGYPQMNFVVGPRVVSPQPVSVIPTSYCDASHLPAHLIMSAHSAASSHHQHSNHHHHQTQSQTPVVHPAPSPVHQVPNQPPPPHTPHMYHQQHHQLQATHHQSMGHPMHHHHHPGFPGQPVVLMQQQQQQQQQAPPSHHHLHHHHHHMGHLLPQMTIIPTSAAMTTAPMTTVATPPYAQHP